MGTLSINIYFHPGIQLRYRRRRSDYFRACWERSSQFRHPGILHFRCCASRLFQGIVDVCLGSLKGSELVSGQQALSLLTNNGLCSIYFVLIFAIASFFVSLPRTLSNLTWLGLGSALSILIAGLVGIIGAGANPVPGRVIQATVPQTFNQAFLAITNPVSLFIINKLIHLIPVWQVFAYAGSFVFISVEYPFDVQCEYARAFHVCPSSASTINTIGI